jgi:glutaminyl-tRNA synthetase
MSDEKESGVDSEALQGRELPSGVNSPALIEAHLKITNGKVRTRFPPEPNGYLHVGHAKSMNMNFSLAFDKLGVPKENRQTIFRFDDTNPEAESQEYIDSLTQDVAWMGWKPHPTTYSSDYFQELYDLAVELIKRDKAYVCHQSKVEIEASREIAKQLLATPDKPELLAVKDKVCSPWRNRPVEESLKEFDNMRKGMYGASDATLRMKMDMSSPNPNMWDQIAYRIKYVAHPHAGDKWCIYPTYDYTHCLVDSLEHIDYSICTLEFETRRESYFWLLEALDLYRPKVYEMSRLNLTNTLLSKRKLLKLVNNGYMRGWSDPRMPTIQGLRRRGYNPTILNAFCNEIGVTRNYNVVQYDRLATQARNYLHLHSPRVMGLLKPIQVVMTNERPASFLNKTHAKVPHFPFDDSRGTHSIPLEDSFYIDSSDFRVEDSPDFYGLAPNKVVGLRYFARIRCDSYESNSDGSISSLKCSYVADDDPAKPKVYIQWVGEKDAVSVEVRMYNNLFLVEEPTDENWEEMLNPSSEVIEAKAMVDSSIFLWHPVSECAVQFERTGFFTVDSDSTLPTNVNPVNINTAEGSNEEVSIVDADKIKATWKDAKLIFNLTVALNSSKPKEKEELGSTNRSRKAQQMALEAEKERLKKIPPQEYFKQAPHDALYKEYDADGIPTTDKNGEPISKSQSKKLKKEWEKQKKLYESANK